VAVRPGDAGGAEVTVSDTGPGTEPTSVEPRSSDGGSSGLGLDIALRTAEASGGELRIASSPAGTTVTPDPGPPSQETTVPRSSIRSGRCNVSRSARGSLS
jgi:signal transduction histidine kinase